jgi:hypothetical protein
MSIRLEMLGNSKNIMSRKDRQHRAYCSCQIIADQYNLFRYLHICCRVLVFTNGMGRFNFAKGSTDKFHIYVILHTNRAQCRTYRILAQKRWLTHHVNCSLKSDTYSFMEHTTSRLKHTMALCLWKNYRKHYHFAKSPLFFLTLPRNN